MHIKRTNLMHLAEMKLSKVWTAAGGTVSKIRPTPHISEICFCNFNCEFILINGCKLEQVALDNFDTVWLQ